MTYKELEQSLDSNAHLRHSLVKILRRSQEQCFIIWNNSKSNLTKKTFKRLDTWLLLMYSRHSFRCSSHYGFTFYDEYVAMTRNYFIQYTQQGILEFRNTLIQHLKYVKKSIDERAQLKRKYDSWVNERQMQITEEKDASNSSGNDAHDDGADIRPIYDEEPMAKEGEVDQNADKCHDTCPLPAILTDNQIPEHSYQSLESENICLKKTVAQFQKDFSRLEAHYVLATTNIKLEHKVAKLLKEDETLKKHYKELFDSIKITRAKAIEHTTSLIATNGKFKAQLQEKGFAITALKNKLRKLKGNSANTKFAKQSILGKPMLQSHRNQSVVRKPTAFKSERPRISKPRSDSQVDVNYDLSKPVTTHYLPKEREAASAKPHHMIASRNSRISSKNMPRFSSNDMVHNHYPEEAKKKTQERNRNSKPSLIPSARSQSTAMVANQHLGAILKHLGTGLHPRVFSQRQRLSELGLLDHSNEQSSSKMVPKVVPLADKTFTS
nr:hypothetical protein [Tanacetum cinerariifolium]